MLLKDTSAEIIQLLNKAELRTKVITNVDSDYEICNIQDSDVEVNSLKSFGIMRLTELFTIGLLIKLTPKTLPDKKEQFPMLPIISVTLLN